MRCQSPAPRTPTPGPTLILAALLLVAGCKGNSIVVIEDLGHQTRDFSGIQGFSGDGGLEPDLGCADCTGMSKACCAGRCVDVSSDAANCGACGAACPGGSACCGATCADLATDPYNCGRCGTACVEAHASASCTMGACALGECNRGFGDCDQDPANGCETDLHLDLRNCGACKRTCDFPHGVPGCANGCYLASCVFGFDDCNGDPGDGCETSTVSDPKNCGGCNHSCPAVAHAKVFCSFGGCAISACDAAWLDCDGDPANGCEVNVFSDAANCGRCGNACPKGLVCRSSSCTCPQCNFANAKSSCINNVCVLDSCLPGFFDCNGMVGDGCEADTTNDPANCGGCGKACPNGNLCSSGMCSLILVSDKSWKMLQGNPPGGWEQPGFDDSKWTDAVEEGAYPTAPWNAMPAFDAVKTTAKWIWYYDSRNGGDNSTVYFRRHFTATAVNVTLTITVDDNYVVWLDGVQVAQSNDVWSTVHIWQLKLTQGHEYVFAVKTVNTGGPGGLLFDLR
jgi:stigma-specific protein Stig1